MTPSERKRLEACLTEVSEILYNNSDTESITTLEDIETVVREEVLEHVSPQIALFLLNKKQKRERGENEKSKVVLDS
ncbi:hypothetical protein CWATWH0003_2386 [Crocosphaera watsonii WH 0003]|nr:hypothetical protein CWATWH0003_2386 [Crocosphaera watsonii WH 0003]